MKVMEKYRSWKNIDHGKLKVVIINVVKRIIKVIENC